MSVCISKSYPQMLAGYDIISVGHVIYTLSNCYTHCTACSSFTLTSHKVYIRVYSRRVCVDDLSGIETHACACVYVRGACVWDPSLVLSVFFYFFSKLASVMQHPWSDENQKNKKSAA